MTIDEIPLDSIVPCLKESHDGNFQTRQLQISETCHRELVYDYNIPGFLWSYHNIFEDDSVKPGSNYSNLVTWVKSLD